MTEFEAQNPINVANFVIDLGIHSNQPVTNLKLQKILFFLQGYSLHEYGRKLIDGNFSKWKYGPVEEEVYFNYKENGSSTINSMSATVTTSETGGVIHRPIKLSGNSFEDKEVFQKLTNFTEKLLEKDAWELVDLTHQHASWINYKKEIYCYDANDYTDEEIKKCYEDMILHE